MWCSPVAARRMAVQWAFQREARKTGCASEGYPVRAADCGEEIDCPEQWVELPYAHR